MSSFIADRLSVTLIPEPVVGSEATFQVYVDNALRGKAVFLSVYQPGVSISRGNVAVWGGMRLYISTAPGQPLLRLDQDDEVHEAYLLDDGIWCLVREISVVVLDVGSGREMARFDYNEVLLESVWRDKRLVVRDFYNRELVFEMHAPDYDLIPVVER